MTKYSQGRKTEYKILHWGGRNGYISCRTAGSHSPWDVILVNEDKVRLIQAKRTKKFYPSQIQNDLDKLRTIKTPDNVSQELWVWENRKGFIKKIIIKEDK